MSDDVVDTFAPPPSLKPFEQWAKEKDTPYWVLAAAKAVGKWAEGKELSETEFDRVVNLALNASMG